MKNNKGKRTFESAWLKTKKMLGLGQKKREKLPFKVNKPSRKRKNKERSEWKTLLFWFIAFPVLLPAAILWALLLSNEQSVSRAAVGNFEYEETMRGNAMGSAFLMILFLFAWSFAFPQGILMWIVCTFLNWSISTAFWACLLPSILLGIMYISIVSKVLFDDNKRR